jgi:hypothetical protein
LAGFCECIMEAHRERDFGVDFAADAQKSTESISVGGGIKILSVWGKQADPRPKSQFPMEIDSLLAAECNEKRYLCNICGSAQTNLLLLYCVYFYT